ncbi:uncharacterized protein LOC144886053 isoform X3 [Branchiostoma floridae x Branchiostoma japonicum]
MRQLHTNTGQRRTFGTWAKEAGEIAAKEPGRKRGVDRGVGVVRERTPVPVNNCPPTHPSFNYCYGYRMDAAIELTTSILHRSPQLWHRYYVALYEGKLAGTMVIKFHDDKLVCMGYALMNTNIGPTQCYVDTVGVDAEFRGKGIGKALMERADVEARQRGCKSLFLWVTQNNRAVRLYERQGYVITHSFGGWFTGWASGCRDWYNMEKNL